MATVTDIVVQTTGYGFDSSGNQDAEDMVGLIAAFGMESPPTGWVICEGATLNSSTNTQYAALFAKIGTTWGGSGATSFAVPDLRGHFLRSWSNGGTNDNAAGSRTGGDNVGSSQVDRGQESTGVIQGSRDGGPNTNMQLNQGPVFGSDNTWASMTVSHFNGYRYTYNTGSWSYHTLPMWNRMGSLSEGRSTNMYVMYCIKY